MYCLSAGARYADERGMRVNTVFFGKETTVYTLFTPLKVNSRRRYECENLDNPMQKI